MKPAMSFFQLFQSNRELVDEIRPAFGGATFIVIGGRCGTATNKLPGYMPAKSGVRQCIHNFAYSRRELP